MENYYDELIKEIQDKIDKKMFSDAKKIIDDELKMPYIPSDIEKKLHEYQKEVNSEMQDSKTISPKEVIQLLNGDKNQQMIAIINLQDYNLRKYIYEIKEYLINNPDTDAASLLIASLIEQKIDEEITYNKNGLEYEFNPSDLESLENNENISKSLELLSSWITDNPSLLEMCKSELVKYVFGMLPLEYEEEDIYPITQGILRNVAMLMNMENYYHTLITKLNLEDVQSITNE